MNITVETTVSAPIAKVWRAYTTPADIMKWNSASDDWHTTAATVDLRGMLAILRGQYGVRRVMCEGGPGLLRSLLEAGLVDELNVTFCPRVKCTACASGTSATAQTFSMARRCAARVR